MRFLGLFFICSAPALLGFFRGEEIRRKMKTQEAMLLFFENLQFEIQVFLRPQSEIFHSFENPHLEKIGFLPDLRRKTKEDPCGALDRALRSFLEEEIFPQREKDEILFFASRFGMQSKTAQIADCSKLSSFLTNYVEKRKDDVKNQMTLSRLVGGAIGIGLFILLI